MKHIRAKKAISAKHISIDYCTIKYKSYFSNLQDILAGYDRIINEIDTSSIIKSKTRYILESLILTIKEGNTNESLFSAQEKINDFINTIPVCSYLNFAKQLLYVGGSQKLVNPLFFLLDVNYSPNEVILGLDNSSQIKTATIQKDVTFQTYSISSLYDIPAFIISDDANDNIKQHINSFVKDNIKINIKYGIDNNIKLLNTFFAWFYNNSINNKIKTINTYSDAESSNYKWGYLLLKSSSYETEGNIEAKSILKNMINDIGYKYILDGILDVKDIECNFTLGSHSISIVECSLTPLESAYIVDVKYTLDNYKRSITFISNNVSWQVARYDIYELIVMLAVLSKYHITNMFSSPKSVDELMHNSNILKAEEDICNSKTISQEIKSIILSILKGEI